MKEYITLGIDKNGEGDFGINSSVRSLSLEDFRKITNMLSTAIYIAEMMWRESNTINPTTEN